MNKFKYLKQAKIYLNSKKCNESTTTFTYGNVSIFVFCVRSPVVCLTPYALSIAQQSICVKNTHYGQGHRKQFFVGGGQKLPTLW